MNQLTLNDTTDKVIVGTEYVLFNVPFDDLWYVYDMASQKVFGRSAALGAAIELLVYKDRVNQTALNSENKRKLEAFEELLNAAQMMLRLVEGEELEERYDGETTILRDAIAKAEGRETT